MNMAPKSAPSVAIFDKTTATAIFPVPTTSETTDVVNVVSSNSSIDSAIISLEFADSSDDLNFDIHISVDTTGDSSYATTVVLERTCKFYDEALSEWATKGCTTLKGTSDIAGETTYQCTCNHTTSFAIILSATDIADTTQSTVSTYLMSINIIFLILTIMCIAPFSKFRTRRLMQIQTQLCLSLCAGHIGFLIVGGISPDSAACVPGVIIVQYLFLVSIAWSVCASVTLYEKIVNALKSYGKQDKNYFTKCLGGCWFCPIFMVVATYLTSYTMDNGTPYLASTGEIDGENVEACWVGMPWKLVGFMIPVYLCLALNLVLFIMIAKIIIRAGKSGSQAGHAREIKALVSITFTVGLPWLIILGATIGPIATVFQWLFIIVAFLQGPVMFVCFVIFQEDVLTNIFNLIGKQPPAVLLQPKSSKAKTAPGSEISNVRPTSNTAPRNENSDIVRVKNADYSPNQRGDENIYSKVDEEAPPVQDDNLSSSSNHHYETTAFTQHGEKGSELDPPPAVEQDETYENPSNMDIAQSSYPHVPQLV